VRGMLSDRGEDRDFLILEPNLPSQLFSSLLESGKEGSVRGMLSDGAQTEIF